jgi:Uma2 family endonuclease
MSTEEYLRTPESLLPTELAYGTLRVADSPMPRHQAAVGDFFLALDSYVRQKRLGKIWLSPLDVILDAQRSLIVQPDLLFISNDRRHILTDRIRGAPDMVLEILSPQPRVGALNEHITWFGEYGVLECWLFHQSERRLEVLSFDKSRVSQRDSFDERSPIRSAVLPEFERSLGSILNWEE